MKLKFHSVSEVFAAAPVDPLWLAFPLLTPGAITLLGGEPKMSGKTTLTFATLRAMHMGDRFLGRETSSGRTLYLTEDPLTALRQVIHRSRLPHDIPLDFVFRYELGVASWDEVGRHLVAIAARGRHSVVVLDTWNEFTSMSESDENDSGAVRRAIFPLRQIAAMDVAVLINHHFNKSDTDSVIRAMRGSTALPGAVDIVAGYRVIDDDLRELEIRSRFDCANGRYRVQVMHGRAEVGRL